MSLISSLARRSAVLSVACALAGLALPAAASSPVTQSLPVSASVVASCVISSVTGLAFGNYDPANVNATTALNATGSIVVKCTKGDAVTVTLDQGQNAATGSTCAAPSRRMKDSATDYLPYNVYQNNGYSTVWGCATTDQQGFTSATALTPTTLTVYGSIPAGQDVPINSYADTITVSVSF